jgi:hypothetical protein
MILLLVLFHGAVVVDKHECGFIFGVGLSLDAFVTGTEIAGRIIVGQRSLGGDFLLAAAII